MINVGAASTTEQNIAQRNARSNDVRRKANLKQLESIPGQFEEFFVDLRDDVTQEHEGQEDRLVGVERYVQRIERSLVTEQKQRIDMLSLVEHNIQSQVDALKVRARGQLDAMKPHIPIRISAWNQRLSEDELELDEELKRRRAAIERERQRLLKQLDDLQIRLEVEKVCWHSHLRHP